MPDYIYLARFWLLFLLLSYRASGVNTQSTHGGSCLKCRTRAEQLNQTKCSPGFKEACETCADGSNCFDMYEIASRSNYVYEMTIKKLLHISFPFAKFEANITEVHKDGITNAQKGDIRKFEVGTFCYFFCEDHGLGGWNVFELPVIYPGRKLLIMGEMHEDDLPYDESENPTYLLSAHTYIERIIPVQSCWISEHRLRGGCKNSQAQYCIKQRKINQSCRNLKDLRKQLLEESSKPKCGEATTRIEFQIKTSDRAKNLVTDGLQPSGSIPVEPRSKVHLWVLEKSQNNDSWSISTEINNTRYYISYDLDDDNVTMENGSAKEKWFKLLISLDHLVQFKVVGNSNRHLQEQEGILGLFTWDPNFILTTMPEWELSVIENKQEKLVLVLYSPEVEVQLEGETLKWLSDGVNEEDVELVSDTNQYWTFETNSSPFKLKTYNNLYATYDNTSNTIKFGRSKVKGSGRSKQVFSKIRHGNCYYIKPKDVDKYAAPLHNKELVLVNESRSFGCWIFSTKEFIRKSDCQQT